MKRLFFDLDSTGHHGEYLENLILGLDDEEISHSCFVVSALLRSRLEISVRLRGQAVQIEYVDVKRKNFILSRFGTDDLRLLGKFIELKKPECVCLLYLNIYQYALAFPCFQWDAKIYGVFFSSYPFEIAENGFLLRIRTAFTRWRKRMQLRLMISNTSLCRVFVLNDTCATAYFNRVFARKPIFVNLCDPMPETIVARRDSASITKRESGETLNFLIIGEIGKRKGVVETIQALQLLDESETSRITLHIEGICRSLEFEQEMEDAIRQARVKHPRLKIRRVNHFLSADTFEKAIEMSDLILVPYVGFLGSSGIIGHACFFRKPVIASKFGTIGRLTVDLHLGWAVDPREASEYASAIHSFINERFTVDEQRCARYVEESSVKSFCRTLTQGN